MSQALSTIEMDKLRRVRRRRQSFRYQVWQRFKRDKWALLCLWVVVLYALVALLCQLGWLAQGYGLETGSAYSPPSLSHWLGTDFLGRDVFKRVLHGSRIALSIGLVTSIIAIPIGVLLGALAGYFGGWIDELIVWFYSVLASIPGLLLLIAFTYVLGKGAVALYIAIGLTAWVQVCRQVRGEFIKHKQRDYVQAAKALGLKEGRIIFRHILPNIYHIIIICFSLHFVYAIKSEVILSYLGVGIQGEPSWGVMIDDAKLELFGRGVWWQFAGATVSMFILLLALNVVGDALRDATDPKLKNS